jgi:hypothetical protein
LYRHCIFCSAGFRGNEILPSFPVGRVLAFDTWKGRLWVVCDRCSRWNLTPLEERWEACEEADRSFRDSRLRVQSENIGLARLPDGTRLIRVGEALQGEIAAWRYGRQLVSRRKRYVMASGVAVAGMLAASGGLAALGMASFIGSFSAISSSVIRRYENRKVVCRLPAEEASDGKERIVRRWHITGAQLEEAEDGGVGLAIWDLDRLDGKVDGWGKIRIFDTEPVRIRGDLARVVLSRSMIHVNRKGASRKKVGDAVRILAEAGSADAYLCSVAQSGGVLGKRKMERGQSTNPDTLLDGSQALAVEMALQDEAEREAMRGELAVLESAWKAAEEIAEIADTLFDDPLARLRPSWGGGGPTQPSV